MTKQATPEVLVPPEHQVGVFANAFRLLHDSGNEWFLDFLVHSESEGKATVVARVRVQEAFMPSIRDRLTMTLKEVMTARRTQAGKNLVQIMPENISKETH